MLTSDQTIQFGTIRKAVAKNQDHNPLWFHSVCNFILLDLHAHARIMSLCQQYITHLCFNATKTTPRFLLYIWKHLPNSKMLFVNWRDLLPFACKTSVIQIEKRVLLKFGNTMRAWPSPKENPLIQEPPRQHFLGPDSIDNTF